MDNCLRIGRLEFIFILCLFILSILFFPFTPLGIFYKWTIGNFMEAYGVGYNCAQDDFSDPEDYTEGGFDYWYHADGRSHFWYEQGYEEGYKKGARDYVKENDPISNN